MTSFGEVFHRRGRRLAGCVGRRGSAKTTLALVLAAGLGVGGIVLLLPSGSVEQRQEEADRENQRAEFAGRLPEIQSGKFFAVDLRPHSNRPLSQAGRGSPNDLRGLGTGTKTFRGVTFDMVDQAQNQGKSFIRLLSSEHMPSLPKAVEGIKVGGRKAKRLYFLHAMEWGEEHPKPPEAGEYVIHYAGRKDTARAPILNGRNILEWFEPRKVPEAYVGWYGHSGMSWVGVYIYVWENPHPDVAIDTIDFVTHDTGPVLSLIAVTGEE